MKRKKAIIMVELIDESAGEGNKEIARELLEWFREDVVAVPWVKNVKSIIVEER
jgi:hypothetical protein